MKISHQWLQTYFDKPILSPEKLSELFTFRFSEIEGMEKVGKDTVLDVKILPDRAHYALSHLGVAEEVSVLTKTPFKKSRFSSPVAPSIKKMPKVTIKDPLFCRRFTGRFVEDIKVGEAPVWMKDLLTAIGSRTINNIVDATNFCMFDLGQPLHAFDADKIEGDIVIRPAKKGEKITLLDDREITLDENDSVIADQKGPLDIAGVKGGKRAEINSSTKNILLTSCNFNPTAVRITSTKHDIRNEASKRFENEITEELALGGLNNISALIKEICSEVKFGEVLDLYPNKPKQTVVVINPDYISERLGIQIPKTEMKDILSRMEISSSEKKGLWELTIPPRRLDLKIPEDIVEEVGRVYGYEHVKGILPPPSKEKILPLPPFYIAEKIKNILADVGFSEVYLYSLVAKGEVETAHPVAEDKAFARTNLKDGMVLCLEKNAHNADLLGLDTIKVFEIGRIFIGDKEKLSLALGVVQIKKVKGTKSKNIIEKAVEILSAELGVDAIKSVYVESGKNTVCEIDLSKLLETYKVPNGASYDDLGFGRATPNMYKQISQYPFIVRDIALFVPDSVGELEVWSEIEKGIDKKSKNLLVRKELFDVFKKDGKISYAFRMVFQSMDKTLTNQDVNGIMDGINAVLKNKGWEVR
ncbi:MAG: phenylalanine--tRNA ligase subunit beta [Candidatus Pacebacteria bacterium]|nr:phenylalanine--tRNA ligase subunit beta [Candidatus Paceibacterota bacterium]